MITKHTFKVLNSNLKPIVVKSTAALMKKQGKQQLTLNFRPLKVQNGFVLKTAIGQQVEAAFPCCAGHKEITCCAQLDTSQIFYNYTFDKGRLKTLVSWSLKTYGEYKTINLLENLKKIGFESATKAGISLGIEDLKIPPKKALLLYEAEEITKKATDQYNKAEITGVERFQRLIDTWHRTSEQLKQEVIDHFEKTDVLNPVYMMAFSGARGNISQVRQLVGMRGLMADAKGQIIDYPIRSNFREGLTLTEYIISSYGARKGIVDTALRTANAGYLTRRLVDVAQHVVISNYDCGTKKGIFLGDMKEGTKTIYSLQTRLIGRVLARDVYKASPGGEGLQAPEGKLSNQEQISVSKKSLQPNLAKASMPDGSLTNDFKKQTRIKLAVRNQEITPDLAFELTKNAFLSGPQDISSQQGKVFTRSPLTCETKKLICQLCYGWSLAQGNLVSIGEAVGIVAAQSIGEPGTQLTMRTFHTGGVFSGDISDQIRAPYKGKVHYFEQIAGTLIRTPEGKMAFLTKVDGSMCVYNKDTKISEAKIFKIPAYTILYYKSGDWVIEKQVIAQISTIARQQNMRDDSELTVKSQIQGQFFVKTLQIQEKYIGPKFKTPLRSNQSETTGDPENETNPLLMTKIMASWDWGYAWILSCKLYKIPIFSSTDELKLVPKYGDFVDRNSVMSKIKWVVPPHGGNLNYVDIYSDNLAKSYSNTLCYPLTKELRNPFSTTKKAFVKKPNTLFTNINLKKNLLAPQLQIHKITYNKTGYFVDNPNLFIFLPNNLKGLNSTQTNFNTRSQIFNKSNVGDTLINNNNTKHTFNLFKPTRELSNFFGLQVFPKTSFLNSYIKSFGYCPEGKAEFMDKKGTGLLTSETIFALNYKGLIGSIKKYRSTEASLPCLGDKLNAAKVSPAGNKKQKLKSGGLAVIVNKLKNQLEVRQGFVSRGIRFNSKAIKATKLNKLLSSTNKQKVINTNYQNYLIFCYTNIKKAKLVTLQNQSLTKSLFNNLEFGLKSSSLNQKGKTSTKSNSLRDRGAKNKDLSTLSFGATLDLTRNQKYFGKQVWSDSYSRSHVTVDSMLKANAPKSTSLQGKLNLNKTTKSYNIAQFWKNKVSTNTLTQTFNSFPGGDSCASYSLFNSLNLLNNSWEEQNVEAFNGAYKSKQKFKKTNLKFSPLKRESKKAIKKSKKSPVSGRNNVKQTKSLIKNGGKNRIALGKANNGFAAQTYLSKKVDNLSKFTSAEQKRNHTHFNCLGYNWLEHKGKLGGFIKLATQFETNTIKTNVASSFAERGRTKLPILISRKSFKQCISSMDGVGFASWFTSSAFKPESCKTPNKLSSKLMQNLSLTKLNQLNTNLLLQNQFIFVCLTASVKQKMVPTVNNILTTSLVAGKPRYVEPLNQNSFIEQQKLIDWSCFTNLTKKKNIEIMIWLLKRLKTFTSFFTSVLSKADSLPAPERKLLNKEKQTAAYYSQKQLFQNNLNNLKAKAIKGNSNFAEQTKRNKAFDLLNSNHFLEAFNLVKSQYIKQESLLTLSKPSMESYFGFQESNKIILQRIVNLFLTTQVFGKFTRVAFKLEQSQKNKVKPVFKPLQKTKYGYQIKLKKVFAEQVGKKISIFSYSAFTQPLELKKNTSLEYADNSTVSDQRKQLSLIANPYGLAKVKPSQFIYKTFNLKKTYLKSILLQQNSKIESKVTIDKELTNHLGFKMFGNSFSLSPCIFDKQLIYSLSSSQSNLNFTSQVIKTSLDFPHTVNKNNSTFTKLNGGAFNGVKSQDSNIQKKAEPPNKPGLLEWVDSRFNKGKNQSKESLPKLDWFVNPKTPRFLPSEFIKVLPTPANPTDSSLFDSNAEQNSNNVKPLTGEFNKVVMSKATQNIEALKNIKSNYLNLVKVHKLNAHGTFISKNVCMLLNYKLKSENQFVQTGFSYAQHDSQNKSILPDKQNNLADLTNHNLDLHQELLYNKPLFDLHLLKMLKINSFRPVGKNKKTSATRTFVSKRPYKVKYLTCGLKQAFKSSQKVNKTISVVFKSNSSAFVKPLNKLDNNSKYNFQNLRIFNKQITNYAVSPISKVPNAHLVILPYLKNYGLLASSNDKVADALRYDLIKQQKVVLNNLAPRLLNNKKSVKTPLITDSAGGAFNGVKSKRKHKHISNILLNYNQQLDKTVKKTNIYKSLEQLSRLNNPYIKLLYGFNKTNIFTELKANTYAFPAGVFSHRFENQKINNFLTSLRDISNLNVTNLSPYYKSKVFSFFAPRENQSSKKKNPIFNSLKTKDLTTRSNKVTDLKALLSVLNHNSFKNPHYILLTDLSKFAGQNQNNKLNAQSFVITYNIPSGIFDYQFKKVDVNLNHISNSNIIFANVKQVLKESLNSELLTELKASETNQILPTVDRQFRGAESSKFISLLNTILGNYINLSNISPLGGSFQKSPPLEGLLTPLKASESNPVFIEPKTIIAQRISQKRTKRELINTYLNYNPSFTHKKTLLALFNIVCFELNLILKFKNYKYGLKSDTLNRTTKSSPAPRSGGARESNLSKKVYISPTTFKTVQSLGSPEGKAVFSTASNIEKSVFNSTTLNYFNTNWFLTNGDQSSQNTEIPSYFTTRLRVCFDNINYSLNSLINTSFLSSYAGEIIKQPIFKNNNYIFNEYYKSLTSDVESGNNVSPSHQELLDLKSLDLNQVELIEKSSNYPFIQKQAITNNKQRCLVLTKNDLISYNFTLKPYLFRSTQEERSGTGAAETLPLDLKPITVIQLWSKHKSLSSQTTVYKPSLGTQTENRDQFKSAANLIQNSKLSLAPRFSQISPAKVGTFVLRGDIAQKSFAYNGAELESNDLANTKLSTSATSLTKVYSVPGQIVHVHSEKVTIRKAQPIFISANSTFHSFHGDFVQSKEQVITLIYQKLKTGDIIQGIPKVEQFFESRTTKRGRLFRDNLPNLLKGLFVKYYVYSLKLLKQGYTETNSGVFKLSPTGSAYHAKKNSSGYSAQGKSKTPKLANLDFPFVALQWAVKQSFYKIQQIAVDGVLRVYRSQGVTISDKHLEIIVKQMTTKVRVIQSGQTGFFPGELVDLDFVETLNLSYSPVSFESTDSINPANPYQTKPKQISIAMYYEPVILGITKASLQVDSFLSSASFQQTARILSQSALFNKKDFLKGVKENVILGNLIPAGTGYLVSFFD
jgi:DNA-directed RNA polymerase subunit beta'